MSSENTAQRREVLSVRDVRKTYRTGTDTVDVLKGVSLSVVENERLAIVGRSGAGKSTLLHILGVLDRPDAGQVTLNGRSVYALPAAGRTRVRAEEIGFIFQSYQLLPDMDIVENVMLPAIAARMRPGEARARARELLCRVGLEARLRHYPLELSGGEQQRVACARALMNTPCVVLADEPTGNLDEDTGRTVMETIFELTRERGHALVLVTHSHATAGLCDRVVHLEDGVLNGGA